MAEHDQLVAEMAAVSKLSIQERLLLAKSRRVEQLRCYERQWKFTAPTAQKSTRNTANKFTKKTVRFDSKTNLFEAASRNDAEEVYSLLKSGECLPDTTNSDGFTILHQCCIDGNLELIRSLIENFGASVNQADHELWTPLHTVALCGRSQVAKTLIDHGAHLLALNIDGNMPYDICDDDATLDVIELEMSKQGVTQDQIEDLRTTNEKLMLEDMQLIARDSGDLEMRGTRGETFMHIAAANGYIAVAKFLLDAKMAVDIEDENFWQPIHCAAKWRQLPVLELLLINGGNLNSETAEGRTPLDLCDDPDIRTWMTELRDEFASKRLHQGTSHQRLLDIIASKSSVQMQTSTGGSCNQLYSSSISLADGINNSSSNRHLPTSEKESMSRKVAQDEAKTRISLQSGIEETPTPPKTTAESEQSNVTIDGDLENYNAKELSQSGHLVTNLVSRNGNVTKLSTDSVQSAALFLPSRKHDNMNATMVSESKPKSCLKKMSSSKHHDDLLSGNCSREKSQAKLDCCIIN